MPAVQVPTAGSAVLVAADSDQSRKVTVQNLGPNAIWLAVDAAAAAATGLKVIAATGQVTVDLAPGSRIEAIADTALQVSPADTRLLIR